MNLFNLRKVAVVAVLGGLAVSANAIFIDPAKLKTSVDGATQDVDDLLDANGYAATDVGTSIGVWGDQINQETFLLTQENAIWSILWQVASNGPRHRLGYYTDVLGANPTITWVLGDLDLDSDPGDLVTTSSPINIASEFGLAFDSGDGSRTIFFSQTSRNPDVDPLAKDHLASLLAKNGSGYTGEVITTWEDSLENTIDEDYNDFAVKLAGTRPVPEPASMAALALGAGLLLRRRARKS